MLRSLLLLLGTAALLQGADPAPPRDDSAAEKLGWHLATKAYTFHALTLEETIEISRALGVKYFEINPNQLLSKAHPIKIEPGLPGEVREEIRQLFAKAGVQPVSFGVVKLTGDEAYDRTVFEFAKALGLQQVVSEPPAEAFGLLDQLTAEYGVKVAVHNHPIPSPYALPETELAAFQGHSARIGVCADVGHWQRSGLRPVDALRQLEGHLVQLHFKDVNEAKKDVIWGTGQCDVPGMLRELHRQKFQGLFSMEYEGGEPPALVEEMRACVAVFDKLTREIAAE